MTRKSGSGRTLEVAFPYAQTVLRRTTRTDSGIVGTSSAGSLGTPVRVLQLEGRGPARAGVFEVLVDRHAARGRVGAPRLLRSCRSNLHALLGTAVVAGVAELGEEWPRLELDVGGLLRGPLVPVPTDRVAVHGFERTRQRLEGDAAVPCDLSCHAFPVRDEAFVADLDDAVALLANGRHVPPPRPGGAAGVGDFLERAGELRLDPEARVVPVRLVRVVTAAVVLAQPAALEQGAGDVAAVADHVDGESLRIGTHRRREDEGKFRRLLDAAQPAYECEPPHHLEAVPDAALRLGERRLGQCRDRRLQRRHLAEVDEPRERPDRPGDEARPGTRGADDEDRALVARDQPVRREAGAGEDAGDGGGVEGRRLHAVAHARGSRRRGGFLHLAVEPSRANSFHSLPPRSIDSMVVGG